MIHPGSASLTLATAQARLAVAQFVATAAALEYEGVLLKGEIEKALADIRHELDQVQA